MTVLISVQLTLALLRASYEGYFTAVVSIFDGRFGGHYIRRPPNAVIVMRINVIVTYLAHDQKIEVQILYPHIFFFRRGLY